jgi:hypothetical protein
MQVPSLAVLPSKFARLNLRLLFLAAASLLMPWAEHSSAQTFNSSGGIAVSSTIGQSQGSSTTVSGLTGTVASISLNFNNLNVSNLNSVAIVLVSPSGTALDVLSGVCGDGSQQIGNSTFTLADSGDTGPDNVNGMVPTPGACPSQLSGTYFPSDWFAGQDGFNSPGPSTYKSAGVGSLCPAGSQCGSDDFGTTFALPASGTGMNGTWTLYIADQVDPAPSGSLGSWSLTFTTESATATTTSLSANPNGSTSAVFTSSDVNNGSTTPTTVTLTATVSPIPSGGTVTFYDSTGTSVGGGTVLASAVAVNGSGQAQANVTFTGAQEGTRSISAVYSGVSGSFASSNSSVATVVTVNHPYNPSGATFCNGPVKVNDSGGGTPFPSKLVLGNGFSQLQGTIESVTVSLNNINLQNFQTLEHVGLLLQAPGAGGTQVSSAGNAFDFLSYAGGSYTSGSLTISDSGTAEIPPFSSPSCTTCLPTDDHVDVGPENLDTFPSPAPSSFDTAAPTGSGTFLTEFGGQGAGGTWSLYLNNEQTTNGNLGQIGSWCLNFTMQAGAHPTATTATGTPNPATFSSPATTATVNLTANVTTTDSSGPVTAGSVTFTADGATNLGTIAVSNGQATLNASLAEGTHQIVASYGGTNTGTEFGVSTATFDVRVDKATTASGSYAYCNSGSITAPGLNNDVGAASPYPSNIQVSNLPGTVKAVTVTLNGFSTTDQADLMALLVGPGTNRNLDFFSLTGNNSSSAGPFNITFADGASAVSTEIGASGTFEPTSYNNSVAYPQCPQNASLCGSESVGPPLGTNPTFTPTSKAAPAGTGILGNSSAAGVFGGTTSSTYSPIGTWSLYLDEGGPTAGLKTSTIANGWCLNFTENLPSISFSGPSAASFEQGGTGSLPAVTITNNGVNGAGSIGDPAQSTANAMTRRRYAARGPDVREFQQGTDWSCGSAAGQVVTCTNEDTVAFNGSFAPLTINVSVSNSLSGGIGNNTVAVSDSQAGNTPASQSGSVTIDVPPAITSANSTTFTAGVSGTFTVTTSAAGVPTAGLSESGTLPGAVTFTDNGDGTATIAGIANVAGNYQINITAQNGASPNATQTFTLTVAPAAPASIAANSGTTPQTATVNSAFPNLLAVTVLDAFSNPVPGVSVTFTAPSTGASGTFSNSTNTISVNTDGTGVASAGTFTANATNGPYTVTAAANSLSTTFSLINAIANNLWIGNSNNTTSAFADSGLPYLLSAESAGGTGIAIDQAGNVWSLNSGSNSVAEFSNTGTVTSGGFSGGGLATPTSLAIDGSNQVWITNSGGILSVFNSTGTPVSSSGYTVGSSSPTSIAIDISGNLWIANSGSNSVTKVLGGAAPTVPLAAGVANGTPAIEP